MLAPGTNDTKRYFDIPEGNIKIDQCSYGGFPKPVLDKRLALLKEQNSNPRAWFMESSKRYYDEALTILAEFVNADKEGLFIVDNSTMAANVILKSVRLPQGSEILLTTHIYKTIKNISTELNQLHGMKRIIIHIPKEIHDKEEIVRLYQEQFNEHPNIGLALIDYITSPSSIVMPVKEIVELCKRHQVISFVDGFQTVGHIPLDLNSLQPDYFVGSLHKWTFTALSGGFFWVGPNFRRSLRPLITAYSIFASQPNFLDVGIRDFSSIFTLPTAIKCFKQLGGLTTFLHHANEILPWAESMLCEALGTTPRKLPKDMKAPMIGIVCLPHLPPRLHKHSNDDLVLEMAANYHVHTAGFFDFNDKKWVRFTVHVYNRREDYVRFKDVLVEYFKISK